MGKRSKKKTAKTMKKGVAPFAFDDEGHAASTGHRCSPVYAVVGGRKHEILAQKEGTDNYIVKCLESDGLEKTQVVAIEAATMEQGTFVSCHTLKSASHLNGKFGKVVEYNRSDERYVVSFADKDVKPASVKASNLKIAFELPPEVVGQFMSSVPARRCPKPPHDATCWVGHSVTFFSLFQSKTQCSVDLPRGRSVFVSPLARLFLQVSCAR